MFHKIAYHTLNYRAMIGKYEINLFHNTIDYHDKQIT